MVEGSHSIDTQSTASLCQVVGPLFFLGGDDQKEQDFDPVRFVDVGARG